MDEFQGREREREREIWIDRRVVLCSKAAVVVPLLWAPFIWIRGSSDILERSLLLAGDRGSRIGGSTHAHDDRGTGEGEREFQFLKGF